MANVCNHAIVDNIIITSSFSLRNNNNHRTRKKHQQNTKKGELFVALGLVAETIEAKQSKNKGNRINRRTETTIELLLFEQRREVVRLLTNNHHRHRHYQCNQLQAFLLNNSIHHFYFFHYLIYDDIIRMMLRHTGERENLPSVICVNFISISCPLLLTTDSSSISFVTTRCHLKFQLVQHFVKIRHLRIHPKR